MSASDIEEKIVPRVNHPSVNPWAQSGTGLAVDLINPSPAMIDLEIDVAESLARTPRFAGHVRSGPYSVAQHSVLGADALMRETGDRAKAAAFLLHDGHEFVTGDFTTPAAKALALYAGAAAASSEAVKPYLSPAIAAGLAEIWVKKGLDAMKARIDRAVYGAAGIAWPLPDDVKAAVALMDLRMLITERRHLLGPSPKPWGGAYDQVEPIRMVGRLRIWPWPEAADEFRDRLERYLPLPPRPQNPKAPTPAAMRGPVKKRRLPQAA